MLVRLVLAFACKPNPGGISLLGGDSRGAVSFSGSVRTVVLIDRGSFVFGSGLTVTELMITGLGGL